MSFVLVWAEMFAEPIICWQILNRLFLECRFVKYLPWFIIKHPKISNVLYVHNQVVNLLSSELYHELTLAWDQESMTLQASICWFCSKDTILPNGPIIRFYFPSFPYGFHDCYRVLYAFAYEFEYGKRILQSNRFPSILWFGIRPEK